MLYTDANTYSKSQQKTDMSAWTGLKLNLDRTEPVHVLLADPILAKDTKLI